MEAIRGKRLTIDKRAIIPEDLIESVQLLSGHKITMIIEGEDVKVVAVEALDETKAQGQTFANSSEGHEFWYTPDMDIR
ncbi:MAG TPA: hypothetical protein VHS59_09660 [Bacillota bacterium]|nr:hypothetical protein [Bacillota bacterium]